LCDNDELAALRKRVEELEAKAKPPEKKPFVPMTDEQWRDEMRALSERRMDFATPPSVVRDWAVLDDATVKGITLRDARAPTGPAGSAIPSSQPMSNVRTGGSPTPGWVDPIPLRPPAGIDLIDRAVNAALPHGPEWGKGKG